MDTKRIARRYPFEGRFRIRLGRDGRGREIEGWARDISESGLGAFIGQQLHLGEAVTLILPLGGRDSISIQAKVSRILGTQYGFQFITLSAGQRSQIQTLVEGKTPLEAFF